MAYNDSLQITSTTYAGEFAAPIINAAILPADSIANQYVTLIEGVKDGNHVLNIGSLSNTALQTWSCDFSENSDIDLSEVVLSTTKFKFDAQICKADFRNHWLASETGAGFNKSQLPKTFQDWLIDFVLGKINERVEYNIWQGNYDPSGTTAAYTDFDGILAKLEDDASTVKVDLLDKTDGTTQLTSLTVAEDVTYNIEAALNNLPTSIAADFASTKIFVSPYTYHLYVQHQASLGGGGGGYDYNMGEFRAMCNGYEVCSAPGFANDTILVAKPENLFFGTDTRSDFNEFTILDMKNNDASDNVRMRAQFTGGCQVGVTADCVMVYPDAAT